MVLESLKAYCAQPPAELTPLFPPMMSKQVYVYEGVLVSNSRCGKNSSMKAFMNHLSSYKLGFSLFKVIFPPMCCAVARFVATLYNVIAGDPLSWHLIPRFHLVPFF
ncbi:hypothetical protein EMCRGX_G001019 [Ephydatia muelleri]